MMLIVYLIFLSYFIFLIWLIGGWRKAKKTKLSASDSIVNASVLIPLRNEINNLPRLFKSLNGQLASRETFEVIFINDHSTDASYAYYEELKNSLTFNHQWLNLPMQQQGKKAALAYGIEHSKFEVIVSTDADVQHQASWLHTYQKLFAVDRIKFAFGLVEVYSDKNLFSKIQQMEFASLMLTSGATWAWGIPSMCNGANLAFRKSAYHDVKGYQSHLQLASGDDEFLYHAVYKMHPDAVYFLANPEAAVIAKPKTQLQDFISQRKRWASKWKHHKFFPMQALALFVALFQFTWLALPFVIWYAGPDAWLITTCVMSKIALEVILLAEIIRHVNRSFSLPAFLILQIVYAPYVVISGLLASFQPYTWKGRSYHS